jgi:hypothetical protein
LAPGDVRLDILTVTGDAAAGPGGNVISSFETSPSIDVAPVAIDDNGFISFAANVQVGGDLEYGFYQSRSLGEIATILQTDGLAPGLSTVDLSKPGGFRNLELNPPGRGFVINKVGTKHAFAVFTRFDGPFFYGASGAVVDSEPITWSEDISENRSLWPEVDISDGRGTTQTREGGTSGDMVISESGHIFWSPSNAIFRATSRSDIHAVMFTDTPAPGFDESENAMLDAPFEFRGVDSFNNAVFHCRVTKASGFHNAVYRQNFSDNSLTLLMADGITELPFEGETTVNATTNEEDVAVIADGTVFIRGRAGTKAGFWKIGLDGELELVKFLSDFPEVETDQGPVGFRSVTVDFADWAVSEDHSIFFTADVRNGANGINQEGVWRIDPGDNSIQTIARAPLNGQFGDAPGTGATYGPILQITAAGPGRVVFTSQLSDGNEGLFATDVNGGVVKILIEGSPLVECEAGADEFLECENVESFHFTPDIAGEKLIISKGSSGLNNFGEIAVLATLESGVTALVRATYEGEERAKGDTYIWDAGLDSGIDWHEFVNGKSNWVDEFGVRRSDAPTRSNAEVIIPSGFFVELNQPINEIASLDSKGNLELFANLSVREMTSLRDFKVNGDSELISKGEVIVDSEVFAGNSGVRVISSLANSPVTTKGSITGVNTGIRVTADNGMTLDNEASVSAINSVAMWAVSDSGDIVIKNRETVSSSGGSGIVASSVSGNISIASLDSGNSTQNISAVGSGIDARSAGDVDITFNGEIGVFASDEINDDWGIRSESTNGAVSVVSRGDITATGTFGPGGIFAKGQGTVIAKHEGTYSGPYVSIRGMSTQGDVTVDGRNTFIASELGGLWAESPNGNATVLLEGEMAAGQSIGIQATSGADILVESKGPIQTIGSINSTGGAHGILADSTGGNVTINHSGDISTFHTFGSDGISISAAQDIMINSSGSVSTFSGSGIFAETTSGFVDIKHKGTIDASNEGHGIYASSGSGSISIISDDAQSSIDGTGDDAFGTALEAIAGGSVLIEWAGDINAWGSRVSAVSATSSTAGVNVSTKGSVAANGSSSYGVLLSGPSNLTLNVLGGVRIWRGWSGNRGTDCGWN